MKQKRILFFRPLLITLLLFASCSITAQVNNIDSLIKIVDTMKGQTKLKTLLTISSYKQQKIGGFEYIDKFEQEAIKQSNTIYLGKAYAFKSYYYYTVDPKIDSVHYYIDKASKLDSSDKTLEPDMQTILIHIYMLEGKFELALYHIQNLLQNGQSQGNSISTAMAYTYMAEAYLHSNNITKAKDALKAGYDTLSNATEISPYHKAFYLSKIFYIQMELFNKDKQYDLALNYCDSIDSLTNEITHLHKMENYNIYSDIIILGRIKAYIGKGNLEKAEEHINSLENIFTEATHDILIMSLGLLKAEYNYKLGNYQKALELIDPAIAYLQETDNKIDICDAKTTKSKILNSLGRYNEAYDLLNETSEEKISLYLNNITSQASEFHTIYNNEKARSKMEARLQITQIVSIALFCIVLLSICIVLIIRRSAKVKDKKNKKIHEQYILMKSYIEEIKTQREIYKNLDTVDTTNDNKPESLADRIAEHLEQTKAFKNKDLSRNELALSLGTNRQYLTDAIREKTGKTFKDYICYIRLEYAHAMLIENQNATVEEVYTESGFSSRSTFNRLFRDRYGMSPNELREITKERMAEFFIQDTNNKY